LVVDGDAGVVGHDAETVAHRQVRVAGEGEPPVLFGQMVDPHG